MRKEDMRYIQTKIGLSSSVCKWYSRI